MNLGCWSEGIKTKDIAAFKELLTYKINIAALSKIKKKGQGNNIHLYSEIPSKHKKWNKYDCTKYWGLCVVAFTRILYS